MTPHLRRALLLGVIFLSACEREEPLPVSPSDQPRHEFAADTGKYLPYGVPIPPGTKVARPPQPYDPAKHGPPDPDPIPQDPALLIPDSMVIFRRLHTPRPPGSDPAPAPGAGSTAPVENGWWLYHGDGIVAADQVELNLWLPSRFADTFIYSPTHVPGNSACIEMTTAHRVTSSGVKHEKWFWDHCVKGGSLDKNDDMTTQPFRDAYVRLFYNHLTDVWEEGTYGQVSRGSNDCWIGYLYNYSTGRWDGKAEGCGQRQDPSTGQIVETGWSIWEGEYPSQELADECHDVVGISASRFRVLVGSNEVKLNDPAYAEEMSGDWVRGLCWIENSLVYVWQMLLDGDSEGWHALTPGS